MPSAPTPALSATPPAECDFAVVGAGIVGLAVARELALRHDGALIAVLEREDTIAGHQSGHATGVIHAGIYYRPGSLKARLCVEGARELYAYCAERGIRAERCGKVIVAVREHELAGLAELERRGRANGVPGLRRIGPDELREIEPHAAGLAALHSPATGIVSFAEVAKAFAADLAGHGGVIAAPCPVRALRPRGAGVELEHARGRTRARAVVACAGLWADRLAVACGAPVEPRIVPFRGAFARLRRERRYLVRGNIYPVPDPELPFLGMHLTRGADGEVLGGPSALMVAARDAYRLARVRVRDLGQTLGWPGTWRMLRRHWRQALREARAAASRAGFAAELQRLLPELRPEDLEPAFAGVRAQALNRDGTLLDDFVLDATERALHVRNAPSPAATACLPLARLIADRLETVGF